MSRVSTYLNFNAQAEEAFNFYKEVFGGEFVGPIQRFGEMPGDPSQPSLSEAEQNLVLHVALPILGGHVIMATDIVPSSGMQQRLGNNITINLEPDTVEEADRLYNALAEGGSESTGMNHMPWGAYWGCTQDRFGIRWMINRWMTNDAN